MRTVQKSVYAFLPSVYAEWPVAPSLLRLIMHSFQISIWSCQEMSRILEAYDCQRKSSANTKSHLKSAKFIRIIVYVFSRKMATACLAIFFWILRTYAPRINTRTALIALLIVSHYTGNFELKIISKIHFFEVNFGGSDT